MPGGVIVGFKARPEWLSARHNPDLLDGVSVVVSSRYD
jgi:hypothetical protein